MGRAKYSAEKRSEIVSSFVTAAIDIMKNEGVESVSIRRVSALAGYSSATLYLYFEDLNELISLASVFYLRNYVRELSELNQPTLTPKEFYGYTWGVFMRHALNKPNIYLNLFFGPNSTSLDKVVAEYYALFPEELENVHEYLRSMVQTGSLRARNKVVLTPYAIELGMDEEEIGIANDLTVAYFRFFLNLARSEELTDADREAYTEQFLKGVFFVLRDDPAGYPSRQ